MTVNSVDGVSSRYRFNLLDGPLSRATKEVIPPLSLGLPRRECGRRDGSRSRRAPRKPRRSRPRRLRRSSPVRPRTPRPLSADWVPGNLLGVASKMMPRTRARLNDLANGAFDRSFSAFLAMSAPRTHYLRDVPAGEFPAWARPRGRGPRRFRVRSSIWRTRARPDPDRRGCRLLQGDPPALGRACSSIASSSSYPRAGSPRSPLLATAVHALPPEESDRTEPAARSVTLFIHRDADHRVRFPRRLTPSRRASSRELLARVPPLGDSHHRRSMHEPTGPRLRRPCCRAPRECSRTGRSAGSYSAPNRQTPEQPSFRWNDASGSASPSVALPSLGGGFRPHDSCRHPPKRSLPRILLERPRRDSFRTTAGRSRLRRRASRAT